MATILDYLAKNAAECPDSTAIVAGDKSVTYAELDTLSGKAAAALIKRGVRRGDCVGISYDRDLSSVLSVYAVLKSGAAYIPLNPAFPKERLDFLRKDAGIKLELGYEALDINKLASESYAADLPEITGDDKLSVMYTSGSTGEPKGVVLVHKNPEISGKWYEENLCLTNGTGLASYASLSFVLSLCNIYAAMKTGALLHVITSDILLSTKKVAEYFTKNSIHAAVLPMSFGRKLVEYEELSSVYALAFCGERFVAPNKIPKFKLYEAPGLTETCGTICGGVFNGKDTQLVPADGITAEIINGELVISGDCLFSGYNNRPDLTAEKLRDGKFYTGDSAKWSGSGKIILTGRKDFQVQIRGHRVEPDEIDRRIIKISSAIECATVEQNGKLITFYSGEGTPDKEILSRYLPEYMLPSAFVKLDKLPRNINGKIDRSALSIFDRRCVREVKLTTETERKLAGIWRETLNVESVSRDDNFEELGADSLEIIVLTCEIERVFGKIISPTELLKHQTLNIQAKLIDDYKQGEMLINLRDGKGEPLYFVHTANSGAETYRKFAEHFTRPFYAFDNYNLLYSGNNYEGVQKLAERYISLLPAADTLRLGGWSFGGLIAFEMALQLQKDGVTSELYLIDPTIYSGAERDILSAQKTAPHYREYLEGEPLFERFRERGQLDDLIVNNAFVLGEVARYTPSEIFRGKVTLFRMTKPDEVQGSELTRLYKLKAADNGFGEFTEKLKVVNIADTHDKCLNNAETIREIIANIEEAQ